MRSSMLARASPATGPLGEITRGREKFTQRVGIDGEGRRPAARHRSGGTHSDPGSSSVSASFARHSAALSGLPQAS